MAAVQIFVGLLLLLVCCTELGRTEEEYDKLEYSDIGLYQPVCMSGRRMIYDGTGTKYVSVRTTTRLKWGVPSKRVFDWGISFDRSHFFRRNRRGKPNLLRIDLLEAAERTVIQWVDMQVKGAQKIILKFSDNGRQWMRAGVVSSETLMHRSEGPLFSFMQLKPRRCLWKTENCFGVKARHLKVYFVNRKTSTERPSVVNFRIGACFSGQGGPPPVACRQDSWGTDYAGHVNVTKSGQPCTDWNKVLYKPLTPYYQYFHVMFPDGPVANGRTRNYCRHVGHRLRPGCHTNASYHSWEECDIIRC